MLNRRDAIGSLLIALAAETGSKASGAPSGPAPSAWPDQVFTLESGATTNAAFGETTIYHEGGTPGLKDMTAGSLLLKAGHEPHPPHQHPEEEFVLVTEGTGEILVHGETTKVGPGALMYCEGNKLHGIKNTGTRPMRFYFFKWLAT